VRDRVIERTWQRYADARFEVDEKSKRLMRLTDDAELELVEDESSREMKSQQAGLLATSRS
jgi:hypothetical protein